MANVLDGITRPASFSGQREVSNPRHSPLAMHNRLQMERAGAAAPR